MSDEQTMPVSFRWSSDFLEQVDAARGLASKSAFIRECVLSVIEQGDEGVLKVLRRIPGGRPAPVLPRPMTVPEAAAKVRAKHEAARRARQR